MIGLDLGYIEDPFCCNSGAANETLDTYRVADFHGEDAVVSASTTVEDPTA